MHPQLLHRSPWILILSLMSTNRCRSSLLNWQLNKRYRCRCPRFNHFDSIQGVMRIVVNSIHSANAYHHPTKCYWDCNFWLAMVAKFCCNTSEISVKSQWNIILRLAKFHTCVLTFVWLGKISSKSQPNSRVSALKISQLFSQTLAKFWRNLFVFFLHSTVR